jgi:hypothetical protein
LSCLAVLGEHGFGAELADIEDYAVGENAGHRDGERYRDFKECYLQSESV